MHETYLISYVWECIKGEQISRIFIDGYLTASKYLNIIREYRMYIFIKPRAMNV